MGKWMTLAKRAKDPRWIRGLHLFDLAYEGDLRTLQLTEEDMQFEYPRNGNTLAHIAAYRDKLWQIPERLLTSDVVAKRNCYRQSV